MPVLSVFEQVPCLAEDCCHAIAVQRGLGVVRDLLGGEPGVLEVVGEQVLDTAPRMGILVQDGDAQPGR